MGASVISTPPFSTTIRVSTPALSDDCSDLLTRMAQGRVHGVTSSVAVAEATHKVMLAEVVHRHGVPLTGLIARLKRHPELLDSLTHHQQVAATVRDLRLPVEAITLGLLARGADLSTQHRLLTNDDDFDAVEGITVYKPTRT
jgi:hypothetical protein